MMDEKGRVWFTSRVRPNKNPDWCKARSIRREGVPARGRGEPPSLDVRPEDGQVDAHQHLLPDAPPQLRARRHQTLWTSSASPARAGRLAESQAVRADRRRGEVAGLDGARPRHQRQRQARRLRAARPTGRSGKGQARRLCALPVAVSPADGTIWGTATAIPARCSASCRERTRRTPRSPRCTSAGADRLRAARRRRRRQRRLLGVARERPSRLVRPPQVQGAERAGGDGQALPRGWTLYPFPGPQLRDVRTPAAPRRATTSGWTGSHPGPRQERADRDGQPGRPIYALVDGRLLTFRLPYPSGLFPKNVDGRIDDPKAGWKGRALWTTSGTRTLFHNEGGKEMRHKA